jgi:hypothetical protein
MQGLSSRKISSRTDVVGVATMSSEAQTKALLISGTYPDSHRRGSEQHGAVLGRATAQTAAWRSAGVCGGVEVEDDLARRGWDDEDHPRSRWPNGQGQAGRRARIEIARQVAPEPGRMASMTELKQDRPMPVVMGSNRARARGT